MTGWYGIVIYAILVARHVLGRMVLSRGYFETARAWCLMTTRNRQGENGDIGATTRRCMKRNNVVCLRPALSCLVADSRALATGFRARVRPRFCTLRCVITVCCATRGRYTACGTRPEYMLILGFVLVHCRSRHKKSRQFTLSYFNISQDIHQAPNPQPPPPPL